jgi:hypothetical protein
MKSPSAAVITPALVLLLLQQSVLAWSPISTSTTRRSVDLQMASPDDSVVTTHHTASRRQWIQHLMGSAAAVVVCLPSNANAAADLVSSKAVCDTTVSVWQKNGRIVYLLGTAHVSAESAKLASDLVKDTIPSGVFVELDNKRVNGESLAKYLNSMEGSRSRVIIPDIEALGRIETNSGDTGRIVKDFAKPSRKDGNNPLTGVATAALKKDIGGMYKDIDDAGIKPGEEFINAINEGAKLGSAIVLGDQDVDVSMRHMANALLKTDPKVLFGGDEELARTMQQLSPSGNGFKEGGDLKDEAYRAEFKEFVEKVKKKENIRLMMTQLKRLSPPLYDALVGERDAYMAAGINGLNELESIVAVVGIAHADGIEENLQRNGWKAANPSCSKFQIR